MDARSQNLRVANDGNPGGTTPHERSLTDTELMVDGSAEAFTEIVRRHRVHIIRHIARMIRDDDRAEELTQDLLISVWEALPRWKPGAQPRTYLLRCASYRALNEIRARNGKLASGRVLDHVIGEDGDELPVLDTVADPYPGPEVVVTLREEINRILAAAPGLPVNERRALGEIVRDEPCSDKSCTFRLRKRAREGMRITDLRKTRDSLRPRRRLPIKKHGIVTSYSSRGCRCPECTLAMRDYCRARRQARKEAVAC